MNIRLDTRLRMDDEIAARIAHLCPHAALTSVLDAMHPWAHEGRCCPYYRIYSIAVNQLDPEETVLAEWRLDLDPLLDPRGKIPLSLNDRHHWAAHATKVDAVKARTRNAITALDIPHLDHVHVQLHYRPATNRFRDVDNIIATQKPILDAMVQRDPRQSAAEWVERYEPIIDGDDPRYLTWSPPILHPWERGHPASLWALLRSYA